MRGQWLGSYQGKTQGAVTVELDDLGDLCVPKTLSELMP